MIAGLSAVVAAALLGAMFLRRNWGTRVLDVPEGRSVHRVPTPRLGGTVLMLVWSAALLVCAWTDASGNSWPSCILAIGLPGLLFCLCGLIDDMTRMRARTKGVMLVAIALLAVYGLGWRWHGHAHAPWPSLDLGDATQPMTALWIVASVILCNFIDGIDHLASITGGVVVMVGAAAYAGTPLGTAYATFAGALVGFAVWNVRPARMFLGDSGSQLTGFVVSTVPLTCADLPDSASMVHLPWVIPAAALLPVVIDVGTALLCKWRRSIPMVQAHSDHLYQHLAKIGHAHATVALLYASLALAAVIEVAWIAPRWGLATCLVTSALLLAIFFGSGWWRTREVPWGRGADVHESE